MGLFDNIRQACKDVAQQAQHVTINSGIEQYVADFNFNSLEKPVYDTVHHYMGEAEDLAAYILVLDSINFGSGYFPYLKKRSGMSGYFTVASYLKDFFETHGTPTAKELRDLTQESCAAIFHQPLDNELQTELMRLFAKALNDLGAFLLTSYDGSYTTFISQCNNSAEQLATELAKMPLFADIAIYSADTYEDMSVPIYKRAQITASDLALAFDNTSYGYFKDLDKLTIFADNLVPHVLHVDGVLEYSQELKETLRNNEARLDANSQMEVELRALSIHAVELMVEALRANGKKVIAQQVDIMLWNKGQAGVYRQASDAFIKHRTRTVFY